MTQPKPIKLKIPIMNDAVMYSMMPIDDLMRLRTYIDELIKWQAILFRFRPNAVQYALRNATVLRICPLPVYWLP